MKSVYKIWVACFIGVIATSCNVTRIVTNESRYFQNGDTAITIQTKTIETYNAERNN